jgi:hypothetical protein
VGLAGLGAALLASLAADAHAQELTTTPPTEPIGLSVVAEPQLRFDLFASRLFSLPALSFSEDPKQEARVREGKFPSANGVSFVGVGFDLGVTLADHWVLPCLGVDFATAMGKSDRLVTSFDGSLAELRPWTSRKVDVWALGLGFREKKRRWMFELTVEPGFAVVWADGAIASGASTTDVRASAVSFAARANLEICRRFDPTDRACLFVAPSLYEFGALNGGSAGLRWEFGP